MKIQVPLTVQAPAKSESKNDQTTWFDDLSKEEQDKYIKEHPTSKYAKQSGLKRAVKRGVQKISGAVNDVVSKIPYADVFGGDDSKEKQERKKAIWRHLLAVEEEKMKKNGLKGAELTEALEKFTIDHSKEIAKSVREWKKGANARRHEESKKILAQLDKDSETIKNIGKKSTSASEPIQSLSAVPARKPYAVGAKPLARTAPKHPQTLARELQVDAAKPVKKKPRFTAPPVKGLPDTKELLAKANFTKWKDPALASRFKNADVCAWFNVNGEAALVVGQYLTTSKQGGLRFYQFNSKTELSKISLQVAAYGKKGGAMEMISGTNHFFLYTYAA